MTATLVRPATPADIAAVVTIARASKGAAKWPEAAYVAIFNPDAPPRVALVAEMTEVVGFVVMLAATTEWELENIAVAPHLRRAGVARTLIERAAGQARSAGAREIVLEVRESNLAARCLYESCGFRQTGLRPRYYNDPAESAVLYRLALDVALPH